MEQKYITVKNNGKKILSNSILYGRKKVEKDALSEWKKIDEHLYVTPDSEYIICFDDDFVELAYSFSLSDDTVWPFSGQIWSVNDKGIKDTDNTIVIGEENDNPTIEVVINDRVVANECNNPGENTINN